MLKKLRDLFSGLFTFTDNETAETIKTTRAIKKSSKKLRKILASRKQSKWYAHLEPAHARILKDSELTLKCVLLSIKSAEDIRRERVRLKKSLRDASFLKKIKIGLAFINVVKFANRVTDKDLINVNGLTLSFAEMLISDIRTVEITLNEAYPQWATIYAFRMKIIKAATEIGIAVVKTYTEDDLKQALGTTKA